MCTHILQVVEVPPSSSSDSSNNSNTRVIIGCGNPHKGEGVDVKVYLYLLN
jgi:hypothetical protein